MSEQKPLFTLDKLYVKDVSVEVPNAPKIFLNNGQPSVNLDVNFTSNAIDDGVFEIVLNVHVNVKIGEEQMLLIEVAQAGIFQMKNIPLDQIEFLQNIECPSLLFPYAREVVSDLSTKAGFFPVVLAPINFAFIYQQKQQSQAEVASNTIN